VRSYCSGEAGLLRRVSPREGRVILPSRARLNKRGRLSPRQPFMPHELSKTYEPGAIEACWAEYWVGEKLFYGGTPPKTPPSAKDADRMGHSSSGGQECPPHKSGEQEPTGVTDTESSGRGRHNKVASWQRILLAVRRWISTTVRGGNVKNDSSDFVRRTTVGSR